MLLSSTGLALPVSTVIPPKETIAPLASSSTSLVSLNKSSLSLCRGEGALLVATSNYNVSWTSSNTYVATVNNGYVVGHSAGTATITVTISDNVSGSGLTSDTCTVTVSSTPIFDNGTYFIENMATGKYIDVEGPSVANGAIIQQWQLSGGNYALIPKCSEGTLKALATPTTTAGNGVNLTQLVYSNNTSLNDEWSLTRMSPLNGSELEYGTGNWTNTFIEGYTNCYAYAINNQVQPWDDQLWLKQQPGEFSHTSIVGYHDNFSLIETALYQDYADYNLENGTNLIARSIGKYQLCPAGTYKIALFIDSDTSSTDSVTDYHWYRQDSDGLWSHKPGTTAVTRYDAPSTEIPEGNLIIDPELANRNYGDVWINGEYYGILNYADFVGYYAVSPWGHLYNISRSASSTSSLSIQTNASLAPSSFDNIAKGMTIQEVEEILGSLGFLYGSGVPIAQYSCSDGSTVTVRYEHNQNSELVVSQILKGTLS